MRNVRSALVAAVVGLSLTTACSFSSSRSWGSANNADPNSHSSKGKPAQHHSSKGKPAQHTSKGKPAQKNPTPAVTPTPAPAPVPPPAAQPPVDNSLPPRVPREPTPARIPRDDSPSSGGTVNPGTTIAPAPREPKPAPGLKAAPTP